jgi:hypothetical protein
VAKKKANPQTAKKKPAKALTVRQKLASRKPISEECSPVILKNGVTEAQWLACPEPDDMIKLLRNKAIERKLRLFACVCCRTIWDLLTDESSRRAVEVAERFADGNATKKELTVACKAADILTLRERGVLPPANLDQSTSRLTPASSAALAAHRASWAPGQASWAAGQAAWLAGHAVGYLADPSDKSPAWYAAWTGLRKKQTTLLHHIIGNPFKPYPAPASWPSTVVQLATALYSGQDCSFALHDALVEAGLPELAKHFKEEQSHPKGCWAVDTILNKM